MTITIPDPYEKIWVVDPASGRRFQAGRRTAAWLEFIREDLARLHPGCRLYVIQSCYHAGYEPSAGTHDRDCVLDVKIIGMDWWAAQRFLRERGAAAYFRHTGSWAAESQWHIHLALLPDPGHVPEWVAHVGIYVPGQRNDYYRHTFGLKNQHNTDLDKSWFPGDPNKAPYPVGTPAGWAAAINRTIFDFPGWVREQARAQEEIMPTPEQTKTIVHDEIHQELKGFLGDHITVPKNHPGYAAKNPEVRADGALALILDEQAAAADRDQRIEAKLDELLGAKAATR